MIYWDYLRQISVIDTFELESDLPWMRVLLEVERW